jgi:hypothetical protein
VSVPPHIAPSLMTREMSDGVSKSPIGGRRAVMRRPCLLSFVVLSRKAGVGDDGGRMEEDGLMARWIIAHSQICSPWAERRVPFFRPLWPRRICFVLALVLFFTTCIRGWFLSASGHLVMLLSFVRHCHTAAS